MTGTAQRSCSVVFWSSIKKVSLYLNNIPGMSCHQKAKMPQTPTLYNLHIFGDCDDIWQRL